MPAWPSNLPDFVLRDGYEEGFKDLVVRTKMDTGTTKRRRRFSDGPEAHTFPIQFTNNELDIFKAFYEDDLSAGALSFTKTHPRTEIIETWAFAAPIQPTVALGPDTYAVLLPLEKLV